MEVRGLLKGIYHLEQSPFKTGGEGSVYSIKGNPSQIVKIYNNKANKKVLEDKLTYMLKNQPNNGILTQIAWPIDLVYDQAGYFAGFVMNRLDITNTLNDIYVYPPTKSISYRNKIIIAQNICRIISEVHRAGYVFGDFNPQNIGVNLNKGTVAFLDTDSYHIVLDKTTGKAFRCNVCAPGYAAPELLKKCYDYISKHPEHSKCAYEKTPLDTFTQETDNFALGIHMFKLMNNGYSPFCGINSSSNGSASIASPGVGDEAVWKDNYCFKSSKMPISEAVPPFDTHPDYVCDMFTRAFVDGKKDPGRRPSADEWHKALIRYENELVLCGKNKMHMYRKSLPDCPWCKADAKFRAKLSANKPANGYIPIIPAAVTQTPVQAVTNNQIPLANYKLTIVPSTQGQSRPIVQKKNSRIITPNIKLSLSGMFYLSGWIIFLASIAYTILPMINDGSFSIEKEVLMPIDMIKNSVICTAGAFFLSFGSYFSGRYNRDPSDLLSLVWGLLSCFINATIYYTQHGYNAASASLTWKTFGILLLSFAAAHYLGMKMGEIMARHRSGKKVATKINHRFSIPEILLSLIMLGTCIVSILALMNLDLFYGIVNSYKYAVYIVLGVPFCLMYLYFKCSYHGSATDAWFCASMTGTLSLAMLLITHFGLLMAFIGWCAMAFVLVYLGVFVDESTQGVMSSITPIALWVILIFGTYIDFKVLTGGVSAIGVGAHWWIAAPAIVVSSLAILPTVKEIAGF